MIYVHVGFPKTATTTIQHFLSSNRGVLRRYNYIYPVLAVAAKDTLGVSNRAHNALAIELRRGQLGRNWQRLNQIIANQASRPHIILSGEGFTGCDPKLLREALGDHPVTIIYYVRHFPQLVQSQYSHLTKIGVSIEDFDEFFERRMQRSNFNLPVFFAKWCSAFGAGSLKIRVLDENTMLGGDVRYDILDAIDIDLREEDHVRLKLTRSTNQALGWKTVEILRHINTGLRKKYLDGKDINSFLQERKNRLKRIQSPLLDFTAALSGIAAEIGLELGFKERGDYLTRRQFRQGSKAFSQQMEALRGLGAQVRANLAPSIEPKSRAFLPTVGEVPKLELSAFVSNLKMHELPSNLGAMDWEEILTRQSGNAG